MNKPTVLKNLNTEKMVMTILCVILLIFPLFGSAYDVLNMSYFLSMVILSVSLWLIWGLTGIFSFGQTAFFGVGGYTYAIVSMHFDHPNIDRKSTRLNSSH